MKKLLITILIFISACSSSKNELSSNFSVEFFPDNMNMFMGIEIQHFWYLPA